MDLDVWYSAGRWVGLIELIDMLPAACRLNEAKLNDPEWAELMAAQPESDAPWAPRDADNDLHAMLLMDISDNIKVLQRDQLRIAGDKSAKVIPFPRPRNELTRLREREDLDLFHDMQAKFGFGAGKS